MNRTFQDQQHQLDQIFVAPNGSDRNPGTIDQPLQTPQAAVNKLNGSGGVVELRGGTYTPNNMIMIDQAHGGKADAPLIFQPYNGEKVTIDGSKLPKDTGGDFMLNGAQHVELKDMELKNGASGVAGWGAGFVQVSGNTVHDTNKAGIAFWAPKIGDSHDVSVTNNEVFRSDLRNEPRTSASTWDSGIVISRTNNAEVLNNYVHDTWDEGIADTLSTTSTLRAIKFKIRIPSTSMRTTRPIL